MADPSPALCYLLPVYDPRAATHHLHLYELLALVATRMDLHLVAPSEHDYCAIPGIRSFQPIRAASFPVRLLRTVRAMWRARAAGARIFFVYYQVYPALAATLLARITGWKVMFWSCVELEARSTVGERTPLRRLAHWVSIGLPMRRVFRSVDRLVTCSELKAEHYASDFGIPRQRVAVLHNWTNVERFRRDATRGAALRAQLRIPAGHDVVLFLHTLGEHRGAHQLGELIAGTIAARPRTTFVIAGGGPLAARVRDDIERFGVTAHVRIVGEVANAEVPDYLSAADILINPALWEAFGRVLLEAMAAGVPFVSTDGGRGGTRAFTSPMQQRWIVPAGDLEAFANALVSLLGDPSARSELAVDGLRQVQRYTTERAADELLGILTALEGA